MRKVGLVGGEEKWNQISRGNSSWGPLGRQRIILEYYI
jgi:hypothetical protein